MVFPLIADPNIDNLEAEMGTESSAPVEETAEPEFSERYYNDPEYKAEIDAQGQQFEQTPEFQARTTNVDGQNIYIEKIDAVEAAARGLASVGNLGRWVAPAMRSVDEMISENDVDMDFATYSTLFRKNQKLYDAINTSAELQSPVAYNLGKLGGYMGGGAPLNTIKGAVMLSGVEQTLAPETQEQTLGETATRVVTGAVIGGVAQKAASFAGPALSKLNPNTPKVVPIDDKYIDKSLELLNIVNGKSGISSSKQANILNRELIKQGKTLDGVSIADKRAFIKRTAVLPDGSETRFFEENDTVLTLAHKVQGSKDYLAKGMNQSTQEIQNLAETIIPDFKVPTSDVRNILNNLRGNLGTEVGQPMAGSVNAVEANTIKKIDDYLTVLFDGKTSLTIPEINRIRYEAVHQIKRNTRGNVGDSLDIFQAEVGNLQDRLMEKVAAGTPELAAFKDFSSKYGDWNIMERVMQSERDRVGNQTISGLMAGLKHSALGIGRGAMSGSPAIMIKAVADGFSIATKQSTDGITSVGLKKLNSINKIKSAVTENFPLFQDNVTRLIDASVKEVDDIFIKELGLLESKIDLYTLPLERNMDDLIFKLPQILNTMEHEYPEMADAFETALDRGAQDEIGAIISDFSRTPTGSRIITPGMGFNGKAATATDLMEATSLIKKTPVSNTQKLRHLTLLNNHGILPVFQGDKQLDYVKKTIKARRNKQGVKQNTY